MSEWLDIESAPKDGTEILGWSNRDYVLCWWVTGKDGEGWVLGWETASGYDVGWNFTTPIFWQPLPKPPEQL